MSATEEELFPAATYDLEGTPVLNGRKAKTVALAFDAYELKRSNAEHMALAGRLEPGESVRLTVVANVVRRAWAENDEDVRVTYRLEIEELDA